MTAQEIFNIVWDHLITKASPKATIIGETGATRCVYRTPEGAKCAVGALVTDEECVNWGLISVRNLYEEDCLPARLIEHVSLLEDLQGAHDVSYSQEDRRVNLAGIASHWGLEVPA